MSRAGHPIDRAGFRLTPRMADLFGNRRVGHQRIELIYAPFDNGIKVAKRIIGEARVAHHEVDATGPQQAGGQLLAVGPRSRE